MIRFALVRHSDYDQIEGAPSALQPFPLTVQGKERAAREATALTEWLKQSGLKFDPLFHCSTSLRAWQTAKIFQKQMQVLIDQPIQINSDPALCERSVGSVANLRTEEIESILEADPRYDSPPAGWKSDSRYCLPFEGAESLLNAGNRVARFIDTQLKDDDQVRLFFGHGASFRHAAYHKSVISFCDIARLSMHHAHPILFEQRKGKDEYRKLYGDWKVRQLNESID